MTQLDDLRIALAATKPADLELVARWLDGVTGALTTSTKNPDTSRAFGQLLGAVRDACRHEAARQRGAAAGLDINTVLDDEDDYRRGAAAGLDINTVLDDEDD